MEITIHRDYVDSHKDEWYEEGVEDGTENKGLEIAKIMLESDYPVEEIERLTKLDKQRIIELNGGK